MFGGFFQDSAGQHSYLKKVKRFGDKHVRVFFDLFLHAFVDHTRSHHNYFCPGGCFLYLCKHLSAVEVGKKKVKKAEMVL